MYKHDLLKRLHRLIEQVTDDIKKINRNSINEPRFDRQLFNTVPMNQRGDLFAYTRVIEKNYAQLTHYIEHNELSLSDYLAEKLVEQVTALKKEVDSYLLRAVPKSAPAAQPLDHKQRLHRLQQLKNTHQLRYQQIADLDERQYIEQKIAHLDNQIYRCQKALHLSLQTPYQSLIKKGK